MTDLPDDLLPEARSRIESLLARDWAVAGEHPLASFQGQKIGTCRLIVLLGPKNNVGSRYFQLLLVDAGGRLSHEHLALGLFNAGPYPGYNWVEMTHYVPTAVFDDRVVDLAADGDDLALFEGMSALVPPGGHIMVEYDSPDQQATARILTLGYPPATSPIGYRLFQVGCRSYRDWYISEGGREGPRKIQAFKPLNDEIEREKTAVLLRDVQGVIDAGGSGHGEWGEIARRNAAAIVRGLGLT